jgi:predicted nuclease of restriction endonuclease-like (RecB) superfamily
MMTDSDRMNKRAFGLPADFPQLLRQIKDRIQQAQTRAILAANAELVKLYWDIGRIIDQRQQQKGWGAAVIPRLSRELRNELPDMKGFSERNIKSMLAFYRAYPDPIAIVQQPAAQLPAERDLRPAAKSGAAKKVQQPVAQLSDSLLWAVPWGHHLLLMVKVKHVPTRLWYMQQTLANGWSRNVLLLMMKSKSHARQGRAISNFERLLPPPQSDLVQQTLKDPYIFDFLTLEEPFHERELETNLLRQLERFLLELGQGFAFVGRQYPLKVGDREFEIDLLFYQLQLRSFVVIDLKKGEFKPEYAGKMNFYLGVVDDQLRHAMDAPSIGLILCQDHNRIVAEYALRDMDKPIGISEYELTRALPASLKSALPTVEEIEAELANTAAAQPSEPAALPASEKRTSPAASKPAKKRQPKKGRPR